MDWALLVTLGLVVGFFAGLLGIGGGGIMVPALTAFFLRKGVPADTVVHMALATSLSCIILNAAISTFTHQKHRAILWPLVWQLTLFYALGSFLAGLLAQQLNSKALALFFVAMMTLVAAHLVMKKHTERPLQPIGWLKKSTVGTLIGSVSALLAVGGGSMTVPFLNWHGIRLQQAIATAAALGFPIALAGTLAFLQSQASTHPLSPQMWGHVYWPATLALSVGALVSTPLGAHLTHRLPVKTLKVIFALLLVLLAAKMYFSL